MGCVLETLYTTDTPEASRERRWRTLTTTTLMMVTLVPEGSSDATAAANDARKPFESLVTPATVCTTCTATTGALAATGAKLGKREG